MMPSTSSGSVLSAEVRILPPLVFRVARRELKNYKAAEPAAMDAISTSLATHGYCIRLKCSPCRKSCFARRSKLLAHPSPSLASSRSLAAAATLDKGRCQHRLRSAPGGSVATILCFYSKVPTEITEESKFVPLNADDPIYGPPALLLVGFEADETSKIYQLLKDLDGEFLKVNHFTEDMISLTVWDAMHLEQQKVLALKVRFSFSSCICTIVLY
ncbi:hypothetical protein Taro_026455 [Colocasia esculenta]|uniref:Uncharacterized protein n=1 Tax=Colocasia esculenta TaxID=4460 RepID=A0A843VBY8_COLES|nr:hypothetical protein [Colocasia esculenta]